MYEGRSLVCHGIKKHCYDFSSCGYVNLMPPGHTDGGDSKQAIRARTEFLNSGLYRPVADALCDMLDRVADGERLLVDAGCGEGYYTSLMASRGFSVSGVDLSRAGAEATAKRVAREGTEHGFFAVASVYDLPFLDESVDVVTNIFAPCVEKEFSRVLRRNGILAVVYAGPNHLMGLKKALYAETKENDGRMDLPINMQLIEEKRVKFTVTVEGRDAIQNLFSMTPYYWRTSPSDSEKLLGLDVLETDIDMIIAIYRNTTEGKEKV